MTIDPGRSEAAHEVRLEGFRLVATLLVLGGVVLAAVVGAFLLGRWVESRSHPGPAMGADQGGPLSQVVTPAPDLDVDREANYFDRAARGETEPEPARQLARVRPAEELAAGADTALEPLDIDVDPGGGPFLVQVFAGRDRESAERLVAELQAADYRVRVDSEKDGAGTLFKVRVGGYASDTEARQAVEVLRRKGFTGAWVTRAD